ncbi:MAG: hypothetical protein QOJ29_3665 [Thermoleophilaceae bacterium]|jgi:hypothetical protein|nr:hypothetical protein [Thermoleophilaceae bacterium]
MTSDNARQAAETLADRCPNCAHPWSMHTEPQGCTVADIHDFDVKFCWCHWYRPGCA